MIWSLLVGGFNDRQFFDRDNGMRGGARGMGNDSRRGRSNFNERDDEPKPSNRFSQKEDSPAPTKTDEKAESTWNASPKSVVSDEENWDDIPDTVPNTNNNTSANNSANRDNNNTNEHIDEGPLPQTEPIDDDSREDDFNDFDESAPDIHDFDIGNANETRIETDNNTESSSNTKLQEKQQNINPDTFDIFADDSSHSKVSKMNNTNDNNTRNEEIDFSSNDVQNTTPLYDELHEESSATTAPTSAATETVSNKIETKKYSTEPDIPGVDPEDP